MDDLMNNTARYSFALVACLAATSACSRPSDPAPESASASGQAPTTALGGIVKRATDEAREKMATENLDVGRGVGGSQPKAQISPVGDLLIDGKAVPIDDQQRTLLLDHRGNIIAIAEAGMAIGVQGAELGMKAAGEALKGVFSGNTEGLEKRMEAEGKRMEAEAMKLCARMPAMLASQQALAAAIHEFKPYATMDQSDVDDCSTGHNNTYNAGKDVGRAVGRAMKPSPDAAATAADAAAADPTAK
jgi:hypothetical protein